MKKLDFLVIGAAKAGTTSLFEYLRPHPELYLPAGKEFPFFSDEPVYRRGWEEYRRRFFQGAPEDRLWGTVTPPYMAGGLANAEAGTSSRSEVTTIPRRIRELAPSVRLIAVLRDPVERLLSHYRMDVFTEEETRPLAEVVDQLLSPDALAASRCAYTPGSASYVTLGEYGRILAGYYEIFPPEQIHVVFTQDLARDPLGALSSMLEHIGADAGFEPPNLGVRYLAASRSRRLPWLKVEHINGVVARNRAARATWHALPPEVRWRVSRLHGALSLRMVIWNRKPDPTPPPIEAATVHRLRAHYRPDAERLAALIGREVPWLSAGGTWREAPLALPEPRGAR